MTPAADRNRACAERWDDEIAAYALDALHSDEAFEVRRHLDDCERCQVQLRWLQPAIDLLPASVEQFDPSPALRSRLMNVVSEEAEREQLADATSSRSGMMRALGLISLRPVLVAIASFAIIVAAIGGYLVAGDPDTESLAVTSLASAAEIGGELEVEGDSGVLTLTGLPLINNDEVYQAWLKPASGGDVVPSSAFVRDGNRGGHAVIETGLETADRVFVTREDAYAGDPPKRPSSGPLVSVELVE